MPTMRFARRLSQPFRDLLLPSGPLNFLVRDFRGWIDGDRFAVDAQLREGDKLMFYHGTTVLPRRQGGRRHRVGRMRQQERARQSGNDAAVAGC